MKRKNVLRMLVLLTVLGFGTLFQLQANLAPPTPPTAPTPPTPDTTDTTNTGRPSFWDPSELANSRFLYGINRRQVTTNTLHPLRRI